MHKISCRDERCSGCYDSILSGPDSGVDASDENIARLEELEGRYDDPREEEWCRDDNDDNDYDDCASAWGAIMCEEHKTCKTCPLDLK
jgi:hypothetical protein